MKTFFQEVTFDPFLQLRLYHESAHNRPYCIRRMHFWVNEECGWEKTMWTFGGTLEDFKALHPKLGEGPLNWGVLIHTPRGAFESYAWDFVEGLQPEATAAVSIICRPDQEWLRERKHSFYYKEGIAFTPTPEQKLILSL